MAMAVASLSAVRVAAPRGSPSKAGMLSLGKVQKLREGDKSA